VTTGGAPGMIKKKTNFMVEIGENGQRES